MDLLQRFMAKRIVTRYRYRGKACWDFDSCLSDGGYHFITVNYKTLRVHRVAYELFVGPIPPRLTIDHLCRRTWCCQPAHLEAVTMKVNVLRGNTVTAVNAAKTECIHGHTFTPKNTYLTPDGKRQCITCRREKDRIRWHRRKSQRSMPRN